MKYSKVLASCLAGVLSLMAIVTPVFAQPIVNHSSQLSQITPSEEFNSELSGDLSSSTIEVTGTVNYKKAYEMLNLMNEQRAKVGVAPLKMDQNCLDTAMQRAAEIYVKFSHTRPDGSNFPMFGENILYSFSNDVRYNLKIWLDSPGHRENIELKDYEYCGVGNISINGYNYWVQVFGFQVGDKYKYVPATKSDFVGTKTYTVKLKKDIPQSITVKFNPNGGSVDVSSKQVAFKDYYGTLPEPKRTGYYFNGWYTAKSGGKHITSASIMSKTKNHSLYAHWKKNSYKVTYATEFPAKGYNLHADTGLYIKTKKIVYKNKYSIPAAPKLTKENKKLYRFRGWYDSPTGGKKIKSSTKHLTDGDVTLYARWEKK